MAHRLNDQDRNAVDLLLDKAPATHQNGFARGGETVSSDHVQAVEKILHMLSMDPVEEPSADMVSKTMRFIRNAEQQAPTISPAALPPGLSQVNHQRPA